jgi:imidazolonepropionase-like amidohydrolase
MTARLLVGAALLVATHLAAAPAALEPHQVHALVGARVITAPGHEVDGVTIVVRDGIIVAVGRDVAPEDAVRWDVSGRVIWPAFIDAHLGLSRLVGAPAAPAAAGAPPVPPAAPAAPAPPSSISQAGSRNPLVHPETRARDLLAPDPKILEALRGQGFGVACVVPDAGILRGTDVVIALSGEAPGRCVIRDGRDMHASFNPAAEESDVYPESVMGATAVLRQSLLDADWYRRARASVKGARRVDEDASLEALGPLVASGRNRPRLAIACADVLDVLRAGALAREFSIPLRLRGAGDEYRRLADVARLGVPMVLPVSFPPVPVVADEDEWLDVSDDALEQWRYAPDNPRFVAQAGVEVSLTTDGLADVGDFTKRVRYSVERGLSEEQALAMLTTHPARLLEVADRLGTLEVGKQADFVVATGRPFAPGTEIRETWVDGRRFVVSRDPQGPRGTWAVRVASAKASFDAKLKVEAASGALTWEKGSGGPEPAGEARSAKITEVRVTDDSVTLRMEAKLLGFADTVELHGSLAGQRLRLASPDAALSMEGPRAPPDPPEKTWKEGPLEPPSPVGGPIGSGDDVLIRGVTAWTCGPQGKLERADVLVRDGLIAAVGESLVAPRGVPVVEAAGRHLTPGLIDAHNHSAIVGGVNEGTHSCTSEVRVGDVVDSETISIYRELAGGLTTANLLHGSANCIGGQSQVIHLAWGSPPEELKFQEATPAIKFALGENVKRSNWGEKLAPRYPQTRMGVEQFMREKFQEARDYAEIRAAGRTPDGIPARRDLQLDALAEVLASKRMVHCHSYRQDEILGLMRVADEFGFHVGTFQHVLEGYKVADEIKRHGAMASSFTDWWAYKFEVYDAIPYNPALMWQRGVITSVNSDSTELARRLQLEAAKVVKWGRVPPEEALLFVTLNPAKQLGIDRVAGSIEVGKRADLALWSGDPLSTSSRCEKTFVGGRLYFDREQDVAARAAREQQRDAWIAAARAAAGGDQATGEPFRPRYGGAIRGCSEEEATP